MIAVDDNKPAIFLNVCIRRHFKLISFYSLAKLLTSKIAIVTFEIDEYSVFKHLSKMIIVDARSLGYPGYPPSTTQRWKIVPPASARRGRAARGREDLQAGMSCVYRISVFLRYGRFCNEQTDNARFARAPADEPTSYPLEWVYLPCWVRASRQNVRMQFGRPFADLLRLH